MSARARTKKPTWYVRSLAARKHRYHHDAAYRRRILSTQKARWTPKTIRARNLQKLYNISLTEFAAILKEQGQKCAICRKLARRIKNKSRWYLDHDHLTGKNRGILCHRCNLVIGFAGDNISILEQAVKYLRRHENHGE